ncbi:MAG: phosphotransferase enzyme family protein [Ktedonobacterales bacterium]
MLEFLPLGLDSHAGVYRVVSEQGTASLLKVTSRALYEPRCLVPRYLWDQGVTSVVAPLRTRSGSLWTHLEQWVVTLYPFIEGETTWAGMTDDQWREVGSTFKRIHQTVLPRNGFESLRRETFVPTEYARQVRAIESQFIHSRGGGGASEHALRSSWMAHQPVIHTVVSTLEKLAETLQKQGLPYVICHADLHPANLIRDPAGHVWVIDWDEVMLAPKERDFLFVGDPPTNGSGGAGTPPFWQGYGPTTIERVALTYYRYERVIQDVIVCASDVFLRDDLEEETKADAAHLFQDVLGDGGEIVGAYAAAAHLPQEFVMYRGNMLLDTREQTL